MPLAAKPTRPPATFLSVLIPVRNEALHIQDLLQDLERQTYDKQLFEVLIIDDHSEDGTNAIVIAYKKDSNLKLQLIHLADYPGLLKKKAGIAKGVELATGELIVQTDGDCRVGPDWLTRMAACYEKTAAVFISGPVLLESDGSLFGAMQVVEFAGLVGVGGASIGLQVPNMCNGANLAYVRQSFLEVQGFTGNNHLASGDDEFLMHKLAKRYPERIVFLKDAAATVTNNTKNSGKAFLAQRVRWASKWPHYTNGRIKLLALTVFSANLLLFLALSGWFFDWLSGWQVGLLFSLKLITDGLFLAQVLHFFGRQKYLVYILPLQLVYIPYVVVTALLGLRGSYFWKGRRVT